MANNLTNEEIQTLQNRVAELEQQLAEAQAALQALSSSGTGAMDTWQRAEELDAIIQTLHDPVMVYDQNGVIYMANASAKRAHGFDPNQYHRRETNETLVVRYANGELAHSDDLPSARALKGETVVDEPLTIINASGQQLSMLVTSSPLVVNGVQKGAVSIWHDITENKRIEDAHRESEAKFRSLVETAFEGVWSVDIRGHTTFVNRRMAEMLKYDSPDDLINHSAFDFVPVEDLEATKANFQARLSHSGPQRYDVRLRCRDGSIIWTSVASNNMLDEQGNITGRMAMFMDITERKRAEEALRQSEEKFAQAFQSNPAGMVIIRAADGQYTDVNSSFCQIVGYTDADIIGRTSLELGFLNKVDHEEVTLLFQKQGYIREQEFDILTKNRLTRRVLFSLDRIELAGESSILGTMVDITERKRAEDALAESERRQREIMRLLELDQARLAAVLQHLPVGVWIADQTGRLIGNNPQAEQIWAGDAPLLNSPAEYANTYVAWHPESGKFLQSEEYPVAVALRTGQPVEPMELKIRRFNGAEGAVLASAAPIKDRQGAVTGAVGVNMDITQRKQAEEELQKAYTRMESIFSSNIVGIVIGEAHGKLLRVNDYYLKMLGYTREEFDAGEIRWDAITPPEWVPADQKAIAELLERGICTPYEKEYYRKDGSRVWALITDSILPGMDNEILAFVIDITERKKAEEALRKSEERFAKAFRSSPDAMVISRLSDGLIMEVNEGWSTIFGHQPAEVIGHATIELGLYVNPENRKEIVSRVQQTGAVRDFEVQMRCKSGKIRQISISAERIEINGVAYLLAILRDITEQKQAEQALRVSEERLKRAQEIAHLGSWELDLIGNNLIWSDEVYRIFGLQPQEFAATYQAFLEAVHPEDRAAVDNAYSSSIREGRDAYEIEHRVIKHSSGEVRVVHEKCEHFRDASGQIIRSVGMVHDITERKQAEEALRESERRFHSLADSMPQLVWTALPDGSVDYYNQRYHEYQEIKQIAEEAWEWAPVLHPDDLQPTVDAWQHALRTGEIYQIEHRVGIADGSYRWHLSRGVPMYDENGMVSRWFGTATDIHDLKLAEEKLKEYAERLEHSNRELEQFAFMASHDLQEPLRKIEMFGNLLEERATCLEDRERDYLERMRGAAGRMRDMVGGLLQLSRVSTQGKPFSSVNLSHTVSDVLADLEVQIRRTGGKVEVSDLPILEGDPVQLHQLLQNLIGNALKFHQPEVPPRVKVYAKHLADKMQLFIEDEGIGFKEEDAERIFQPFHRLVGRIQYEGSGIGLAICRRIVERHAGTISAVSKVGQGTTFIVTLPIHHSGTAKGEARKDANNEE